MNKEEIVKILQEYKESHAEQYEIQAMGIFGPVARDEFHEGSDVDVVLRISEPDLFLLVGIKNDLEERFHRQVDLVTYRENMNTFLKQRIDAEAVYA
jgi:predicted nucleotidyltransferase